MTKNPVPDIPSVLWPSGEPPDPLYDEIGALVGVKGAWHRLWGALGFAYKFGYNDESRATIQEIKAEFESLFGRALTELEFQRLKTHAEQHMQKVAEKIR